MNFENIKNWVLARLMERSTWLGVITVLASFGMTIDPDQAAMVVAIGGALAGAIMVFTKDHNVAGALIEAFKDFNAAKAGEAEIKAAVEAANAKNKK